MKKVKPHMGHKIWKWIWIIWLIVVGILSLMPSSSAMEHQLFDWPHLDKLVHGAMYAIMSLTMMKFLQKTRVSQPVIYVLIFCICWGVGMEILQSSKFINRDFEIADIIANIIGCFAGIAITKYLKL